MVTAMVAPVVLVGVMVMVLAMGHPMDVVLVVVMKLIVVMGAALEAAAVMALVVSVGMRIILFKVFLNNFVKSKINNNDYKWSYA
jgi:hypothetical protein